MAGITLPPDYFKSEAEKYDKSTDRKAWLIVQIDRANDSLLEYQAEIIRYYKEAEKLGAVFDTNGAITGVNFNNSTGLVTGVGAGLASIPTGYTQVIGGIMILASSFFQKAQNKKDSKQIATILSIAQSRYSEALKVGEYKTKYESELLMLRILPFLLMGILIYLIIKK